MLSLTYAALYQCRTHPDAPASARLDSRCRDSDRYNDDDEVFKDVKIEFESDLDLKLKSFIYVIRNFDLDDSKSSYFISSLNFKNSVEDSKIEGGYLAAFNKLKKLLKRSSNKLDLLLYDINTINYIVNDKKWFKDDYIFNRGQLKILKIGGSSVIFKGSNIAVFIVVFQVNLLKYCKIVFEDALYLLDIDVNLFSGLKHYKSKDYLEKNRLCISQGGIITRLNIVKTGFFILLKGYKSYSAFANFCFSFYRDDFYIFVPAKPLKIGPIRSNALKKGTPRLGLHRSKDRQQFEVSEGVNIGNNGFKDFNSWESTERGPYMPEDRLCKLVES